MGLRHGFTCVKNATSGWNFVGLSAFVSFIFHIKLNSLIFKKYHERKKQLYSIFLSHLDLKCAILIQVRKKLNIAKNNACKSETRMEGKCVTNCPRNNKPYLLAEKEVFMNAKT